MKDEVKQQKSTDKKIQDRLCDHGRGWVFTPNDFKDLGSRNAIASALKRHKHSGLIRQLTRGLYDYPRTDPELGLLAPSSEEIAEALAGRDALRLQASGAYAANLLGLSTQVPLRIVFLTDGRSRKVQVGKRQIILKQTSPRNMATAGKISGMVIQALRHLGKEHVDEEIIHTLKQRLDADAVKQLMKDIRYAPAWVADIIRDIASQEAE
jgi:hypothetical protein